MTYYSRSQFVMDGYTMTGYNTKADGTGKSYPYDEILVTEDMDDQTILYAQWEKITPSGKYITIDGKIYDAMQECRGNSWVYDYDANNDHGFLSLKNYQGGSIASDIDLSVTSSGQSVVNGSISSEKSLWMNGFTSFSIKPLRIATYFGALTAVAGFIYALIIVIRHFAVGMAPLGWSSTTALLLILGGVILLVLGLIGEYIGRIFMCVNASPQYVERSVVKRDGAS